jgi:hypothetical protein
VFYNGRKGLFLEQKLGRTLGRRAKLKIIGDSADKTFLKIFAKKRLTRLFYGYKMKLLGREAKDFVIFEGYNVPVHGCVFFCSGRRPAAPAAIPPQRGVVCPPGLSSSHHT